MIYLIVICALLFLYIVLRIVSNLIKRDKYITNLKREINLLVIKKGYKKVILKINTKLYYLYLYYGKKRAILQINSKERIIYSYGGKSHDLKKSKVLNNMASFININTINNKIIVMFPECLKMVRYINESELEIINPLKKVYETYIINYNDLTLFKELIKI